MRVSDRELQVLMDEALLKRRLTVSERSHIWDGISQSVGALVRGGDATVRDGGMI